MDAVFTDTNSFLLITRNRGKSSTRYQQNYWTRAKLDEAVVARRAAGATVFWVLGPAPSPGGQRPKLDHWVEKPVCTDGHRPDDLPGPGNRCKGCGCGLVWIGPGPYDWEAADQESSTPPG